LILKSILAEAYVSGDFARGRTLVESCRFTGHRTFLAAATIEGGLTVIAPRLVELVEELKAVREEIGSCTDIRRAADRSSSPTMTLYVPSQSPHPSSQASTGLVDDV
jgi:hypothetical protein